MAGCRDTLGLSQETKVSVNVVRALLDTAEHRGIPRAVLLATAGRDPSWLGEPDSQVPCSEVYQLCDVALELSADHALALGWGTGLQDQAFKVVSPLIKYAPTLRDALAALFRFSKLLTDQPGTHLIEQGSQVTIQCLDHADASFRVQRFLVEMTLSGLYRLIRLYSPTGRVERVCFNYPAPSYRAAYTKTFDAAECFEQSFTGIVLDRAILNAVSPYKDEDLHQVLCSLAERRLMHVTHCIPYSVRAREVLTRQRAPQHVPMRHVARALDISVRSLRRRLAEEGRSYRSIADDACTTVATRLITDERQTIQEAAHAMGFSCANSFHRAFKRWTGTTPNEFRDHCKAGAPAPARNRASFSREPKERLTSAV